MANAKRIEQDIQALYRISEPCEEGCTRLSYTPAYRMAVDYLGKRMTEAGMSVREDNIGTLYGVLEGRDLAAGKIISGSHLDTVRCAGAFDGTAGIVCALERPGCSGRAASPWKAPSRWWPPLWRTGCDIRERPEAGLWQVSTVRRS